MEPVADHLVGGALVVGGIVWLVAVVIVQFVKYNRRMNTDSTLNTVAAKSVTMGMYVHFAGRTRLVYDVRNYTDNETSVEFYDGSVVFVPSDFPFVLPGKVQ